MALRLICLVFGATTLASAAWAHAPALRDTEYQEAGAAAISTIPALIQGMPLDDARAILRYTGASCRTPKTKPATLICYNDSSEMRIDTMTISDIRWTTVLRSAGGRVIDVAMTRDEAGQGPACVLMRSPTAADLAAMARPCRGFQ